MSDYPTAFEIEVGRKIGAVRAGDFSLAYVCRQLAGAHNSVPIVFSHEDPWANPELRGDDGYWTTPSGKMIVHYPNAYKYPTVYHKSTRYVIVGWKWARLAARQGFRRRPNGELRQCAGGYKTSKRVDTTIDYR